MRPLWGMLCWECPCCALLASRWRAASCILPLVSPCLMPSPFSTGGLLQPTCPPAQGQTSGRSHWSAPRQKALLRWPPLPRTMLRPLKRLRPLWCAGLPQEGVAALQEAGLWRYAATLTAHTLKGDERAAALERWAAHVHQVPTAPTRSTSLQHAHLCAESWCWLDILAAGGLPVVP